MMDGFIPASGRRSAACLLALLVTSVRLGAAEAGDLDGDGRVSLADYLIALRNGPAAPGSLDAFASHACASEQRGEDWYWFSMVPQMIYLESLSRGVSGSLPHWRAVWTQRLAQEPLPADPLRTFTVDLHAVLAPGGDSDEVELRLTVTSLAPVRAFSLVLESDAGILRVRPPRGDATWALNSWEGDGGLLNTWWQWDQDAGFRVNVPAPAYLASGGRFVIVYRRGLHDPPFPQGESHIVVGARLPHGTPAGSRHPLGLGPGSEVVLEDGSLIAPFARSEGEIAVIGEVESGWDEGLPPLQLDLPNRRVLGKVELRLADAGGQPPEPGMPIATVRPGDEIVVRAQLRTEVPLNYLHYAVYWPSGVFQCGLSTSLFQNPEDGQLYQPFRGNSAGCLDLPGWPSKISSEYHLAAYVANISSTYPERILEHFKPLGEWADLQEIRLRVPDWAEGGDVQLRLQRELDLPLAEYIPYGKTYACDQADDPSDGWEYDIGLQGAFVRVDSADPPPPPPPPDHGIEIAIGEAAGRPGELVEVPVLARAEESLGLLRTALSLEAEQVTVEAVRVAIRSGRTGEIVPREAARGGFASLRECLEVPEDAPPQCVFGFPRSTYFYESDESAAVVDIFPDIGAVLDTGYPGAALVEVCRLLVRIREGATAASTTLQPAKVSCVLGGVIVPVEPGGTLNRGDIRFAPARGTVAGRIFILGNDRPFVRGDANLDGRIDLSDAVATLGYLFLGSERLTCLDAADADDSGALELTDAVSLLGALFGGRNPIPPPHPECGPDPTPGDPLGCAAACR